MKKTLTLVAVIALTAAIAIGGTLAWLTATTDPVTNTFTIGNVAIALDETTGENYKMVPGETIAKDPIATVKANSEACWLFVEVTPSTTLGDYIDYTVDPTIWTKLEGNVYYKAVAASDDAQSFNILTSNDTYKNGFVNVWDSVTQEDMNALQAVGAVQPTLTFKAYAIQQSGMSTPALAWAELNKPVTP